MKKISFIINGNNYDSEILKVEDNTIKLEVNGTKYKVELKKKMIERKTPVLVRQKVQNTNEMKESPDRQSSVNEVKAPLPGTIISIAVKENEKIKIGDKLLVMEAMKMENNILAEKTGIVKNIKITVGDSVLQNDILLEIQ